MSKFSAKISSSIKYLDENFFFALMLFFNSLPYFLWHTHFQNYIIFPFIIYYSIKNIKKITKLDLILLAVLFLVIGYISIGEEITIVLGYISLFFIYLINSQKKIMVFYKLKNIFVFIFSISIVMYFLVIILSIKIPYEIIKPLNAAKLYDYKAYPFFVMDNLNLPFYRFYSVFDEAGVVGTIVTLFLYAAGYNFREKKNIVFLIAGIISVSFFFILSTLIFYLIINPIVYRKNTLKIILLLALLLLSVYEFTKEDPNLKFFVYDRILIDDGKLAGDNRTDYVFEMKYNKFLESDKKWFGYGRGASYRYAVDSSSYKMLIFDNGIIWAVLFLVFWIGYYIHAANRFRGAIVSLIIFILTNYQRPGTFSPFSIFLFLMLPIIIDSTQLPIKNKVNKLVK